MGGGGGVGLGLFGLGVGLFVTAEAYDLLRHEIVGGKKAPYPAKHKLPQIGYGPKSKGRIYGVKSEIKFPKIRVKI